MKRNVCTCGHFWSQHDAWGCQEFLNASACVCKRIDRTHRYENGAAVEDPLVDP